MVRRYTLRGAATAAVLASSLAACAGQQPPPSEERTPATQPAQPTMTPAPPAAGTARPAPASPRDTAEITLAERRIMVDYGRPFARGRTIMGGLVPYGRVWRTGANAATTLVTQHDLRIGGTAVPAGTYTLYTLPGEREWSLIINRQTGQWGTVYDQAQDLARIPMQVGRTASPVEQFTISMQRGQGSTVNLVMEWENTRASVPVEIVGGAR